MSLIKRKNTQKNIEIIKKDDQTIKKLKINKKSNFINPILTILISFSLLSYVYLFLLNDNNLTPLNLNQDQSFFDNNQLDNRKWGTFKSGHYFALKTLAKQSMVFGLLWFENRIIDNNIKIRHWCDQSDNLKKYTWLKHNFHTFGKQQILDNNLNLTTYFLIDQLLNVNQSSWRSRVQIEFNNEIKNQLKLNKSLNIKSELSLISYFALDSLENEHIQIDKDSKQIGDQTVFTFRGQTNIFKNGFIGKIKIKTKDLIYSNGLNSTINPPLLDIKENVMKNLFLTEYPGEELNRNRYLIILRDNLKNKKQFNNNNLKTNLALRQLIIKVPSIVDFEFNENQLIQQDISFNELFNKKETEFDNEFENKFKLKEKGYSNEQIDIAKAAFSNMIGSIGSFYGFSQVKLDEDNKFENKKDKIQINKYGPLKLLTAVPSRSFFPRGFVWDEGFHQLLISKYDPNLSKIILSSWFNLMNRNGWIPREVILGVEAESRVPKEFIVQNVNVANPPTFFLLIDSLLENSNSNDKEYFNKLYDKLVIWYDWFNRTQIGPKPASYRWKGRNSAIKTELNVKTLSSGLDDYPRSSTPTDQELHLDLFSWMTYATRIMTKLSKFLNHHSTYERFNSYLNILTNEYLDKLHWSDEYQQYCDYGLHSKKVILKQIRTSNNQFIRVRSELEPAKYGCVNEFGYVSLFPLILQLIKPDNHRLGIILDKIKDPKLLWSNYGLRSLSTNSSYYNVRNTEHDPPYWRSAIWLNINYLTLKSLDYYSKQTGPFKDKSKLIYNQLKQNLINNVLNEYKNRNYFFENYDDRTGQGKGCHPFTGWTALITLIMSDNYN